MGRVALMLVILFAPLAAPWASAGGGDCGTGADAPNERDAAVLVAFPMDCAGVVSHPDETHDFYAFDLAGGETFAVLVDGAVWYCLFGPDGFRACPLEDGFDDRGPTATHNATAGRWTLRIYGPYVDEVMPYSIRILTGGELTTFTGNMLLATSHDFPSSSGVLARTGSDRRTTSGVDNAWIDLPAPAGRGDFAYIDGGSCTLEAWFYDAEMTFLGARVENKFLGRERGKVAVPPDTSHVFLREDDLGVCGDVTYAFRSIAFG